MEINEETTYDGHFIKAMLKTRGWTPTMIDAWLGKPDEVRQLGYYRSGCCFIYYRQPVTSPARARGRPRKPSMPGQCTSTQPTNHSSLWSGERSARWVAPAGRFFWSKRDAEHD